LNVPLALLALRQSGPALDLSIMLTISFNMTKNDVVALACNYYATSATVRKNRLTIQIGIAVLLAAIGLWGVCSGERFRFFGISVLLSAVVWAVVAPGWYRSSLRKAADRMIEETSYRKAFGGYTLSLDEEGLSSTSPTGQGKINWEAVERVALTPEHLFIFLVGPQGFAIPRSQVSDATVQEVKAFVESHLQGNEPRKEGMPS
jgi:hypothetical protein